MPRVGVLCAQHHVLFVAARRHKKYVPSYCTCLFTKFDYSALQRLACKRVKSIFRKCLAALVTRTAHPEKVQKHATAQRAHRPHQCRRLVTMLLFLRIQEDLRALFVIVLAPFKLIVSLCSVQQLALHDMRW